MASTLDMIRGRSNIVTMTNNSGGGLVAGDVCIQDTSADENVTTTTSAASVSKVFVAAETIASGAAGKFYESGYCPLVNVNASVTRGRFLFTHTVAKQAAENATYGAGAFGKILKSGTTPSAIIYSATAQVAGAGTIGGSTGSTDNAILRADGTGGATVQSSLATVDDSGGVNIPSGQTYNINNSPHTHVGGSSPFSLDAVALDGTYGDAFDAASLNARWTLRNLVTGDLTFQDGGGSWLTIHANTNNADEMFLQSLPAGDWSITCKWTRLDTNGPATIWGLIAVDSSGNGMSFGIFNDDYAWMSTLANYIYTSQQVHLVSTAPNRLAQTTWLKLTKSGTTYNGYYSFNGALWTKVSISSTYANTMDRFGFGRCFGSVDEYVSIDWFNKA